MCNINIIFKKFSIHQKRDILKQKTFKLCLHQLQFRKQLNFGTGLQVVDKKSSIAIFCKAFSK